MTSRSPIRRFLDAQGFVVLDGGLATELEARGHRLDSALWSARLLLDEPDAVRSVHLEYLEAGADCIGTASYQASFEGFERLGMSPEDAEGALRASVRLAVEAKTGFWSEQERRTGRLEPLVAASAGPYGAFLADGSEYDGRYGVASAVLDAFHRRRLEVLADTAADLIAFETIPSLPEVEAISRLLAEMPSTWAWISFSCRDGGCLWDGSPVEDAVAACQGVDGLAALGINCTDPAHVTELVGRIGTVSELPIVAYPNSGETYDARTRAWTGPRPGAEWLAATSEWRAAGAGAIGGCCRIGPDLVRALRSSLSTSGPGPTLSRPRLRSED